MNVKRSVKTHLYLRYHNRRVLYIVEIKSCWVLLFIAGAVCEFNVAYCLSLIPSFFH